MNPILLNPAATQDFLLIISAYGGFLNLRKQVETMDFSKHHDLLSDKYRHSTMPRTCYGNCHSDEYSFYSDSSTVENEDVLKLLNDTEKTFSIIKEEYIQKLISTEKYYKKLKHQFKEKYPELSSDLDTLISQHHECYSNKKSVEQKVTQLSYRFLGFANKAFYKSNSGYRNFFIEMISKYNVKYDEKLLDQITDKIEKIYDHFSWKPSYTEISNLKRKNNLTEQEIHFLANILKKVTESVSFDDLHNVVSYEKYFDTPNKAYNPEKFSVCYSVVNKNFIKYTNLLTAYQNFQKL